MMTFVLLLSAVLPASATPSKTLIPNYVRSLGEPQVVSTAGNLDIEVYKVDEVTAYVEIRKRGLAPEEIETAFDVFRKQEHEAKEAKARDARCLFRNEGLRSTWMCARGGVLHSLALQGKNPELVAKRAGQIAKSLER